MRERTSEKEHKKRSDAARPTTKSRIHKNAKKAMIASSFSYSNGFGLDFPVFTLTLVFSYAPSHLFIPRTNCLGFRYGREPFVYFNTLYFAQEEIYWKRSAKAHRSIIT